MANSDVQHESDGDGPGASQRPDGPVGPKAILLFPPNTILPTDWLSPWIWGGWTVANCGSPQELAEAASSTLAPSLIVSPWPDVGDATSGDSIAHGLQCVAHVLATHGGDAPTPTTIDGGMVRRGDFLSHLATVASTPGSACWVLMAIHVDRTDLASKLDMTAIFELEERISQRFAALLRVDDVYSIWLELGFGVLVRRDDSDQVIELAKRICANVAAEPFLVADESMPLTVSIGLALPPKAAAEHAADKWFASAHAAQAIALRHGGNCQEGVLSREYEPIPAERVLIIREWVQEAKSGENVMIEFQPVLPLNTSAGDLYSVHAKLRDYRAPLGGVYRHEYLRIAREAGAMVMIDRVSLFSAFEAIEQERARGRDTRLLIPVEPDALEGVPWQWLEAELHRRRHLADRLILELEAHPKLEESIIVERLRTLRAFGVRIGLSDRSGGLEWIATWARLPVDVLRLQFQVVDAVSPDAFTGRLSPWREKGRQVIVDSIQRTNDMARFTGLGVDYLRGRALAAIGPRLDYEF